MSQRGGRENAGDDWQVGDWAECIQDDWYYTNKPNPRIGDRLIVKAVEIGPPNGLLPRTVFLRFVGKPRDLAWTAYAFRKIISDREEPKRLARVPEPVA